MDESRKIVFRETAFLAVGEIVCCSLMVLVFVLCGAFNWKVLWGAIIGFALTVANFFLMAVGTSLAADKAQEQNTGAGKNVIRGSMALRYVFLFVVLFALGKSGLCNILALVLPLAFVRPVLMFGEFFRKKG